jgi:hypothetical protein
MEFSLQDIGSGGWGSVSEGVGAGISSGDTGDGSTQSGGFLTSLENIGVNSIAGLATVGIQAYGKSQGVSSAYTNPAAIAYNSAALTSRPGTFSPIGAAIGGVSGKTLVVAGLVLAGLFALAFVHRG